MKKREFRPAPEGARLEERVVLSRAAWISPALTLGRVLPMTSVQAISVVGSAINLNYRAAVAKQRNLDAAATATGSTVTPAQYRQQTLTNLGNLATGLKAATAALPYGAELGKTLTAQTTTLGQMTLFLTNLPTTKPAYTIADVDAILGGTGFPNLAASANQANSILWNYVRDGVNGGRIRVIGYSYVLGATPVYLGGVY